MIDSNDKFYYLLQALMPGFPAAEAVKSFPPVSEKYEKAINRVKNRFGRDELFD